MKPSSVIWLVFALASALTFCVMAYFTIRSLSVGTIPAILFSACIAISLLVVGLAVGVIEVISDKPTLLKACEASLWICVACIIAMLVYASIDPSIWGVRDDLFRSWDPSRNLNLRLCLCVFSGIATTFAASLIGNSEALNTVIMQEEFRDE